MCDRKDCERTGAWMVGFTFEAVGGSVPVEVTTSLRLCRPCRDKTRLTDVLTEAGVQSIQDMLKAARLAPADPASFRLRFMPAN